MKHTVYAVLALVSGFSGLAGSDALAQTMPAADWVARIEAQARQPESLDATYEAVRLFSGWIMNGLGGKKWQKGEVEQQWPVFQQFMADRGYDILRNAIKGQPLGQADEPYRQLMLALYLRAAADYRPGKEAKDRLFMLDLERLGVSVEQVRQYKDQVTKAGRQALRKAIEGKPISAAEIQQIRLYRIGSGTSVVGEVFLPSHFGYHPYLTGSRYLGGGDTDHVVREANLGKPFHDFLLPTFESVLRSPRYTDVIDYSYHWTYALRPEGVLEFLYPVKWFEPVERDDGSVSVRARDHTLKLEPGQNPKDFVRLSDMVGEKPVLLFINDPVDGPVTEMFPRVEVLYQAYRDRVNFLFVVVNIHDWYYSGMREFFTHDNPSRHNINHSWCVEERARKLKNRYIESPHVTFPAVIEENGHVVKTLYGTGGGANHFLLIDRKGRIGEMHANQHGGLNEIEAMIRRTLNNDGLMPANARIGSRGYRRTQVPELAPVRHRVRLQAAKVIEIASNDSKLIVEMAADEGTLRYEVSLKPTTRMSREGESIDPTQIKPSDTVWVEAWLDQMVDGAAEVSYQNQKRQTIEVGTRKLGLELLGSYGWLRRIFYVMSDSDPAPIVARSVEVVPNVRPKPGRWSKPVTIWACGHVQQIDGNARRLVFERLDTPASDFKGYQLQLETVRKEQRFSPTDTVTERLRVVADWAKSDDRTMVLGMDDAVNVTVNGRFGPNWTDLKFGDFVGVQYETRQHGRDTIHPTMLRVSR